MREERRRTSGEAGFVFVQTETSVAERPPGRAGGKSSSRSFHTKSAFGE